MKDFLKSLLHRLLAEYSIYWIYRCTPEDLPSAPPADDIAAVDPDQALPAGVIGDQAGFLGAGAHAFATRADDTLSAICIYWHGERYAQRNFWPLHDGEAKLVQVITDPAFRGRGAATQLIRHSSEQMFNAGFSRLYARIWHSNTPSLRAFERAGWQRVALALELKRTPTSKGIKVFLPPGRR